MNNNLFKAMLLFIKEKVSINKAQISVVIKAVKSKIGLKCYNNSDKYDEKNISLIYVEWVDKE